MSRIGKKPVEIRKDVKITKIDNGIEVIGPKGKLSLDITGDIKVDIKDNDVTVTRPDDYKKSKALHGLYRSLLQNMIIGVTEGYSKRLELVGIGYKAEVKNNKLALLLGYSHQIIFVPPEDIKLESPTPTSVVITGIDKQLVGAIAAKIRSFRPPEPYKGKGIKYEGEKIRRKAGKTAAK